MTRETPDTLFGKLRKAMARLTILPRALALAYSGAPGSTVISIFLTLMQGLMPVAFIWLVRNLINQLSASPFGGAENFDWLALLPSLITLSLVLLAIEALQPLSRWIRAAQAESVERHVRDLVQSQANRADLAFFESPEFQDQLYRAGPEAGVRVNSLLESLTQMLQSVVTVGALAVLLIPYAWWLPLGLAVSLLPALVVILLDARQQGNWWRASTRDERRADYLNWLITSGFHAAELRLLKLGSHLQEKHRKLQQKLSSGRLSLERRQAIAAVAAAFFAIAAAAGTLALLASRTSGQAISLGDIVLIFQAFYQSQRASKSLLSQFGALIRQSMQLQSLFDYLAYSPKIIGPPDEQTAIPTLSGEIRFENVTFHYAGNNKPSLTDLSATIPAGKITAIVGENGSGKSTLIKLLTRLYDPDSGTIYLDGVDIRKHDPQRLREHFAVLLQDPLALQDTVKENIRVGSIDAVGNLGQKIENAAAATHADRFIRTLEQGIDTHLGRWFTEGTDLSTGQWQRLALTRAVFRDAQILVLDEPTSAMDAITEADWVKQFPALAENKTVILITHRLAAARHADQILVFAMGRVTESGSHSELLAADGEYAALYNAQASHFH